MYSKRRQTQTIFKKLEAHNTFTYRIASGAIAARFKSVLSKLISGDQTGFIPGWYIGENTRLVYDVMLYTEEKNIPEILLVIDFKKAFGSVAWKFIDET